MNTKLADDLAYVRDIAEAGQTAPSLSGRFTLLWSGLLMTTLILHWLCAAGIFGVSIQWVGLFWIGFGVLGSIGSRLIAGRMQDMPGQSAAGNKVDRHTWRVTGLGLFAYAGAVAATVFLRADINPVLFDTILPAAFLAYAVSYAGTAAFSQSDAKWLPVILSVLMSVFTMLLIGIPALYLVAALGVLAIMFIPALQQVRAEPKSVI